jgi:predicted HD phosphohydrolase
MTAIEPVSRATFTAMTEASGPEWDVIAAEARTYARMLPERVLAHMELLRGTHGGFAVDRLEHCLQTATRAYRANRDTEYVVCALLHDIGDTLGPANHADIAATILQPFVSPENHWMVAHHAIFQGYYFFNYVGLDADMREQFRANPHFDRTEEFCAEFDQNSFDPSYRSMSLEDFKPAVVEVLGRARRSIYKRPRPPAAP